MRILFLVLVTVLLSSVALAEPRPYFTEPSLSPDRKEIAFVSGGDIWTVPATGGVASLLVSHSANEARPLYSPDGRQLAFISSRTGNGDIYLLTLASGDLKRLTFDDGLDQLDGWSRDGRWLYFTSTSRDIGGLNDLFRMLGEVCGARGYRWYSVSAWQMRRAVDKASRRMDPTTIFGEA